jgi:hypothetical protein
MQKAKITLQISFCVVTLQLHGYLNISILNELGSFVFILFLVKFIYFESKDVTIYYRTWP